MYSTALFPIGAMTLGSTIPRSLSRCPEQASTSVPFGFLFSGGRQRTTFDIKTLFLLSPAPASSLSSSFPADPTNGRPDSSSLRPGASPTKTTRESRFPSPFTLFFAPSQSPHRRQLATSATNSPNSLVLSPPKREPTRNSRPGDVKTQSQYIQIYRYNAL